MARATPTCLTASSAASSSWGPMEQPWPSGTGHGRPCTPEGGLAVDGQGNIYVADTGNNRIDKLAPDGTLLAEWGTKGTAPGQFDGPRGVAVDSQGNLCVADSGNDRIQKPGG